MKQQLFAGLLLVLYVAAAAGHGIMLQPPGRSSRWRYDSAALKNYNDNGLNCGGFGVQWTQHGGKCGMCGDDYSLPTPRPNELGGQFGGSGVLVASYSTAAIIKVTVQITANHLGHIEFELCDLSAFGGRETEECYQQRRLLFADSGSDRLDIGSTIGVIDTRLRLPAGLRCQHCVLRWTYVAGNNWGACSSGGGAIGCGPQEHFRSCADISII